MTVAQPPPPQLQVLTQPLDLPTSADLSDLLPDAELVAWQHGRDGMVGWGTAWRGDFPSNHQFRQAIHAWQEVVAAAQITDEVNVFGTGLVAFGSFAFDPQSGAGGTLIVPRVIVGRRGKHTWLTTVDTEVTPETILAHLTARTQTADNPTPWNHISENGDIREGTYYEAAVSAALEDIAAGEAEKVVLAREVQITADAPIRPRWLLRRLNSRFHTTHNYAIDDLVGATPEMLIVAQRGQVSSTVLAGTIPLPDHAAEPQIEQLAIRLLDSPKDLVEHAHAVDSVANTLATLCTRIKVVGPEILELPNVLHLVSDITAHFAAKDSSATSLFLAELLHPSAAVCGTPTMAALDLIRRYEDFDRGRYSGPVGWLNHQGDGEWGIALRCAHISGSTARLYAGCGIVPGSNPMVELLESEAKLNPMRWAMLGDQVTDDDEPTPQPARPKLHLVQD
ncbi:MAG: isochorismate synthase [Promicromonosporaceae bacterium]|nr:isochorismate synthase [Promicromonosporaceae bacterium]